MIITVTCVKTFPDYLNLDDDAIDDDDDDDNDAKPYTASTRPLAQIHESEIK